MWGQPPLRQAQGKLPAFRLSKVIVWWLYQVL